MFIVRNRHLVVAAFCGGFVVFFCGLALGQDEPGLGAAGPKQPASRPVGIAPTPAPPADDVIARARRQCSLGRSCRYVPRLMAALEDPRLAHRAMALLAELGEPRAVAPLAWIASYSADPSRRAAARRALSKLVASPTAVVTARRLMRGDPDSELRRLLRSMLGAGGDVPSSSVSGVLKKRARRAANGKARASDPSRVIFGSTALMRPKGSFRWTAYQLGLHFFDYAVSDNIEIGLGVALPIAIYGFQPRVRVSYEVHEQVHLGFVLTGGVFGTYVENGSGFAAYGGGPIVTLGSEKLFFNASFLFGARTTFGDDASYSYYGRSDDDNTRWVGLGNFGGSWRLGRWVRLNLEVYVPLHQDFEMNGEIWLVMYGIRIFGKHIFGDISMVIPIFDGAEEILRYTPLGLPLLAFGAQW